jgi:SAM-dependent methyltransferase
MTNTEQEIDVLLGSFDGGRVLDVATGLGGMIVWMVDAFQSYDEIIGIDTTDFSERINSDEDSIFNQDNISFQQMDAQRMTFADASFDTVTISNSLHHMADPRLILAEIWRVLKPGGRIVITEMYRDNQTEEQLTHVYMHHFWAAVDSARHVTHNETYTRAELSALVGELEIDKLTLLDYANLESDPKDSKLIDMLNSRLDIYKERLQDLPNKDELLKQLDMCRQRLVDTGFHGATSLIVVGQK